MLTGATKEQVKEAVQKQGDFLFLVYADYDQGNPALRNLMIANRDYQTWLLRGDQREDLTPEDFILLTKIEGKVRFGDTLSSEEVNESTVLQNLKNSLHRIVELQGELAAEKARYDRDVHGVNNEGDPIGGVPGGYLHEIEMLRQQVKSLEIEISCLKDEVTDNYR